MKWGSFSGFWDNRRQQATAGDKRATTGEILIWKKTTSEELRPWARAVIARKHGKESPNATAIVCKHFLTAVEARKYGWFWCCPGGGDECRYKHKLPKVRRCRVHPGFTPG